MDFFKLLFFPRSVLPVERLTGGVHSYQLLLEICYQL